MLEQQKPPISHHTPSFHKGPLDLKLSDYTFCNKKTGVEKSEKLDLETIQKELKELYGVENSKIPLTKEQEQRIKFLEDSIEKDYGILVARSHQIEDTKISMLANANERWLLVPDFTNESQLSELGFIKKDNGNWYHPNSDWYPDPLSEDKVIYIFSYDQNGKPSDVGFGPRSELQNLYMRTQDYDSSTPIYIDSAQDRENGRTLNPGEVISVKKCASGTFCILPVGTKIFTSEGIVEVKTGEIANIKGEKNSVHLTNMTDIATMYKADPFSPASQKLFKLINKYKNEETTLNNEEKKKLQEKIAKTFSKINRKQRFCLFGCTTTPETLQEEVIAASKIAKFLENKYLYEIDNTNFDTALEKAKKILNNVNKDVSLTNIEKEMVKIAIISRLLPKTNAHQHLKGSVPKEVLLKIAEKKGYNQEQKNEILEAYSIGEKGYESLHQFNKCYGIIGRPISNVADYEMAIKGIVAESLKQGQLTTEIRCACDSIKKDDGTFYSPEEGAKILINAINKAKSELIMQGIEPPKIGLVFLSYRGRDWDESLISAQKQAQVAIQCAVEHPDMKFGFDVAGPEDTGWPPIAFEHVFKTLHEHNNAVKAGLKPGEEIGITIHAGETPTFDNGRDGFEAVRQAIQLGVDRIGHGIQAALDEKTLELCLYSKTVIEICGFCNINSIPINIQKLEKEGYDKHPVNKFIEKGIPVSISTDNDAICGTNSTREFLMFLLTGHSNMMDWNNLKKCALDGINAAFITEEEKKACRFELSKRISKIQRLLHELEGAD